MSFETLVQQFKDHQKF